MTPAALTHYLRHNIPLAAAMDVAVTKAGVDGVVLEAPLLPNINVHGTFFGGSAATLCLLAGWSALFLRLQAEGAEVDLVIQRTEMDYLAPVSGPASAAAAIDEEHWPGFLATLSRRGRARITVHARLLANAVIAGRLVGDFVAIAKAPSAP